LGNEECDGLVVGFGVEADIAARFMDHLYFEGLCDVGHDHLTHVVPGSAEGWIGIPNANYLLVRKGEITHFITLFLPD
jgi:hypothetical protein